MPKGTDPETRAAAIQKSRTDPVLIVGEAAGFAVAGGVLNFFLAGANVRFEINREAEKQRQLDSTPNCSAWPQLWMGRSILDVVQNRRPIEQPQGRRWQLRRLVLQTIDATMASPRGR